jgi:phosphoglycolate phosphatase
VGDLRRLIVFDLDGTLIDSRADLAAAANALIAERGGTPLPEEEVGRMVGGGAALLVRRALTAAAIPLDDRSVPRFLELYNDCLLATTRPYPGVPDALKAIAPLGAIAVLTNKPLAPALRLLETLELAGSIAAVLGGDGDWPRKPHPASLLHLAGRFAVEPPQTVMVGDSWIDYATARAAGTKICLARYGFGYATFPVAELQGDEALVDRPQQLLRAISRLFDIS